MTPASTANGRSLKNTLATNVILTVGSRVLYMASRFFLPPIILHRISLELYGVWAACFILIGYFGMSAFGVSNVYIRYVATYNVRNETEEINRLVTTGIAVTLAVSLAVLGGLWFALPHVVAMLHISAEYQDIAFILIFGTAATFVLDLSLGAFTHVLTGLQRVAETTAVWMATSLLEALLIVVLLPSMGVYALLAAFVVRYVIATVAAAVLCRRALPTLTIAPRYFSRAALRLFYVHGGIVQAAGILSMFLYSVEKIIAGIFLGVQATGLFDLGEKFAVMGSQVASSVNGVLLPAASHLHASDDRERLGKLYLVGSRYLSALSGLIMGFLPSFAWPLMAAWIGSQPQFAEAAVILMIFAAPFHFHVLTGPGSALHRAMDRPARELVYPLTQLAMVVASVAAGFAVYGRTWMVVAVAVGASMLASQMAYMWYTNRKLGVSQSTYAMRVLLPSAAPYLTGFIAYLLLRPWILAAGTARLPLMALLAAGGALYAVLTLALFWLGADPDERGTLVRQIRQRLPQRATSPAAVTP